MTDDQILVQLFADHEHLAPDARDVLLELQRSLGGRRRRNVRRSLAVAGVGATVAAVAVGATLLSGATASHHALPGQTAAASTTLTQPPTPTPTADPVAVPAPDHTTIHPGWLPAGDYTSVFAVDDRLGDQEREYDMTVDGTMLAVLVDVGGGTTLPARNKAGNAPKDVTFQGRPAHEWQTGQYLYGLAYATDDSHYVNLLLVAGDGVADTSIGDLRSVGQHMARELTFDGDEAIPVDFVLTYLPDSARVTSVAWAMHQNTLYALTSKTSNVHDSDGGLVQAGYEHSVDAAGVPTISGQASEPPQPGQHPGRPVQGHATIVTEGTHGDVSLQIPDFHDGMTVEVFSGTAVPTLDDLYRVADGIRWAS